MKNPKKSACHPVNPVHPVKNQGFQLNRYGKKIAFVCLVVVVSMAIMVAMRNHQEQDLSRRLVGAWKSESATVTYQPDGTFHTVYLVHKTSLTQQLDYDGQWKLSDGFLTLTLVHFSNSIPDTNAAKIGTVIRYKIEGMDDKQLLLKLPPYTNDRVFVMERK